MPRLFIDGDLFTRVQCAVTRDRIWNALQVVEREMQRGEVEVWVYPEYGFLQARPKDAFCEMLHVSLADGAILDEMPEMIERPLPGGVAIKASELTALREIADDVKDRLNPKGDEITLHALRLGIMHYEEKAKLA